MFEKMMFPLELVDIMGKVSGKTRFQKLMFLTQKKFEKEGSIGPEFNYTLYLHGPFSFDLNNVVDDLVRNGYLKEERDLVGPGYLMYTYELTSEGRKAVAKMLEKKLIEDRQTEIMRKTVKEFGELPLKELVSKAYEEYRNKSCE